MSVDRPRTTRLVSYPKCRGQETQAVLQSYHPHLEQYTKTNQHRYLVNFFILITAANPKKFAPLGLFFMASL